MLRNEGVLTRAEENKIEQQFRNKKAINKYGAHKEKIVTRFQILHIPDVKRHDSEKLSLVYSIYRCLNNLATKELYVP